MRLVWSQTTSSQDRPRSLLLLSVVFLFFGGVVMGSGGEQAPRPFRAAVASRLAAGGVLFVVGGASLVLQRSRRGGASLSLADPLDPASGVEGRPYRQEEQP